MTGAAGAGAAPGWFARGDPGYEAARRATVWNARVPDRYPDLVVQAAGDDDVVRAVRHATAHGLTVGIRSGGHSWSASHLRNGGMLLDVSRLDGVDIDPASATARVGPGARGDELCAALAAHGLFFPAGHCRGVGVGGYLLQGGYGWNSRAVGVACESVTGIDVVTASGEQVFADAHAHPDLYWAARGAGPGFMGVVTRFHLRLHPLPAVCGLSLYAYPMAVLEDVVTWARAIGADVDRAVELQVVLGRSFAALGVDEPAVVMGSPVFAASEAEARSALAILETCPVRHRALVAIDFAPTDLDAWYGVVTEAYPDGARYAVDNMWTSASAAQLLPGLRRIADTLPPPPSHVLWLNWGPSPARPDMAYSLEDDIYLALYGVWTDEADDARYAPWPAEHMAAMAPLASGIQLADENLGERPDRFVTDAHLARLDDVRRAYDPVGRFHSWMGRP